MYFKPPLYVAYLIMSAKSILHWSSIPAVTMLVLCCGRLRTLHAKGIVTLQPLLYLVFAIKLYFPSFWTTRNSFIRSSKTGWTRWIVKYFLSICFPIRHVQRQISFATTIEQSSVSLHHIHQKSFPARCWSAKDTCKRVSDYKSIVCSLNNFGQRFIYVFRPLILRTQCMTRRW